MNAVLNHPLIQKFRLNVFKAGEMFFLFKLTMQLTFTKPFYFKRLVEQIVNLGVGSISITIVIGLTMGSVMTLNFGYGLSKFGGTLYVPAVVSVSLVREMAPIFTSLLVAGRIGSGMASPTTCPNCSSGPMWLRPP